MPSRAAPDAHIHMPDAGVSLSDPHVYLYGGEWSRVAPAGISARPVLCTNVAPCSVEHGGPGERADRHRYRTCARVVVDSGACSMILSNALDYIIFIYARFLRLRCLYLGSILGSLVVSL